MRLFTLFTLFLFSASPAMAEKDPIYGSEFRSMKDHMIYKLIQSNAEDFKKKLAAHPTQNKALVLFTGKTGVEITDHYLGMVDFLAENTPAGSYATSGAVDVGTSENGYVVARAFTSAQDLKEIARLAPSAFRKYVNKKGEMDWNQWVEQFEGDPQLALKSISLLNYWTRGGLKTGYPAVTADLIKLVRQFPFSEDNGYGMYPLKKDAFGLKLDSSRNFGEETVNYDHWGSAYKTVSGMNLALAGKAQGYSDRDIQAMVSRAALVYESSDLLYDHLGFFRPEVYQNGDNKNSSLQPAFQAFAKKVREMLKTSPDLMGKLIGSIFSAPELGAYIPKDSGFNTDDDLVLVFLLLNYQYEKPEEFEAALGPLFPSTKEGEKIKNLFVAGVHDARTMAAGGDFVLEKLKKVPLAEINPCITEPPFQGVLQLKDQVQSILSFMK